MSGICSPEFKVGSGKPNTEKLLIIGPSNSGKTTLAVNLIVYEIKPFAAIVFIVPKASWEDDPIKTLQHYSKEANVPFYLADDPKQIPEIRGGCVYVIDDHYTSSNRNPAIEKLLMSTINMGRKSGIHVIYIAQSSIRLPSEIKTNNTGIFISGEIINQANLFTNLKMPEPEYIPPTEQYKWYEVEKEKGKVVVTEIKFPAPKSKKEIINSLSNKKGSGKINDMISNSTPIAKKIMKLEDAATMGNNAAAAAVAAAAKVVRKGIPSPLF